MQADDKKPDAAMPDESAVDIPVMLPAVVEDPPVSPAPKKRSVRQNVAEHVAHGLWNYVLPLMFLLSIVMLMICVTPNLVYYWRTLDAQGEAELAHARRLGELKAEAEFADHRLDVLDKRANLISLGFRELARKALPLVVYVVNYRDAVPEEQKPPPNKKRPGVFKDPEDKREYVQDSVGAGIIYKPGVLLTNQHVVRHADRLRVTFPSGRSIGIDPKTAVAHDVKTDLAIIRLPDSLPAPIKEETQKHADFVDSDKNVHVGDWVLAMGSPLGLRHTVTHGIVSAKGRLLAPRENDEDLMELLQTDAAIHPGNSGGPLFDQLGRVVGINVMIASDKERNQGIGFAIPSNTVRRIADHLIADGVVPRGYLGIAMRELSSEQAVELKIDGGVQVMEVVKGEAAAKAGIEKGDVIFRVHKQNLEANKPMRHLRQIVTDLDPGAEIMIELIRGDERREVTLTLGKRPANLK